MSQASRDEYLQKMRDRYGRYRGKPARTRLLDEFCEVTGHERKYANKLLRGQRGARIKDGEEGRKRGRKSTYGSEVIGVIFEIWKHSEQPCGKRLVATLRDWLPFYEKRYGKLGSEIRKGVLSISAAQIDRLLAPKKIGHPGRKRRPPRANAAIKALVPVRAESWDAREPGWMEADTVAHCGGDMAESFIWSLTVTDIFSGWTEVRPSWNRGQYSVCEAFTRIEEHLPFTIRGVDTDNGGEFLNHHLHSHFTDREPPVEMTRSRPYRKNDQAHVEQKNSTHVRQLLGHDRLGYHELIPPLFELLEAWSIWRNCFTPTFKQIEKRREAGKTIRVHEKVPQTPCQRLIDHCLEVGDQGTAKSLAAWRAQHDPFELKDWIEKKLEQIWELERALQRAEAEGEIGMEGVAAPILKGRLRYAPTALQNRKHDSTAHPKADNHNPTNQDAPEPSKAA